MILEQGNLVIERGRQKHRLQLQDYPELAAFIDSIRGTLAGDRKALERNYRLSLEGSAEQWNLQLLPLDEKMQAVVKRIRIAGGATACVASKLPRPMATARSCLSERYLHREAIRPNRHCAVAGVFARLRHRHQPQPVHHRLIGIFAAQPNP